jgi:hypothetical protein
MQFISSDFSYGPISLDLFADAHRTEICSMCKGKPAATLNGVPQGRCALCKGKGKHRIALIECDDCQRLVRCDDARSVYVGPGESRGDSIYRPLCAHCDDLDTAHLVAQEREEVSEIRGWA